MSLLALAFFPILFSLFPEASPKLPFGHSREPSKRYRQEIQSDALASLSLRLGYVNRSYSVSLDSLAVSVDSCRSVASSAFHSKLHSPNSTLSQPLDLRI